MHSAILSDKERVMIKQFLETNKTPCDTFRTLKMRIKRNYKRIAEDFELIKAVLDGIQKKA